MNHQRFQLTEQVKADNKIRTSAYNQSIQQHFNWEDANAQGLFGPNSMHWKIYRTPGIILGGYSALLLQIAHPAVADGVRQFSSFKKDYLGRAERTFTSMIKIYFGDLPTALGSGKKLHHIHNYIRGKLHSHENGTHSSKEYCANDPELLLWVLSTMIDTSINLYEVVNSPLTQAEKEQFFEESKLTARVMGIPDEVFPASLEAFYNYYQEMINGNELKIDGVALELAKDIFKPPYFPNYFARILAAGLLPLKIRNDFNLEFSPRNKRHFNYLVNTIKWITKLTPPPFGYAPPYYQARYRVAMAKGSRPNLSDRFFNRLAKSWLLKAVSL